MLGEALAALASTGGTALVTAMVTDSWDSIKDRVARLFGRGDAEQVQAAHDRLETSRAALDGLVGTELDQVRTEQEIVWRTRLAELLEAHPQSGRRAYIPDRRDPGAGEPFRRAGRAARDRLRPASRSRPRRAERHLWQHV
jgi:hypothetical protein